MTFLLDVNVLIALIDPGHVAHDDAHEWFAATGQTAWAPCPMTENGVIRIVGKSQISEFSRFTVTRDGDRRQNAVAPRSQFLAGRCEPCRVR